MHKYYKMNTSTGHVVYFQITETTFLLDVLTISHKDGTFDESQFEISKDEYEIRFKTQLTEIDEEEFKALQDKFLKGKRESSYNIYYKRWYDYYNAKFSSYTQAKGNYESLPHIWWELGVEDKKKECTNIQVELMKQGLHNHLDLFNQARSAACTIVYF